MASIIQTLIAGGYEIVSSGMNDNYRGDSEMVAASTCSNCDKIGTCSWIGLYQHLVDFPSSYRAFAVCGVCGYEDEF